jgi:hypothetical protein
MPTTPRPTPAADLGNPLAALNWYLVRAVLGVLVPRPRPSPQSQNPKPQSANCNRYLRVPRCTIDAAEPVSVSEGVGVEPGLGGLGLRPRPGSGQFNR